MIFGSIAIFWAVGCNTANEIGFKLETSADASRFTIDEDGDINMDGGIVSGGAVVSGSYFFIDLEGGVATNYFSDLSHYFQFDGLTDHQFEIGGAPVYVDTLLSLGDCLKMRTFNSRAACSTAVYNCGIGCDGFWDTGGGSGSAGKMTRYTTGVKVVWLENWGS